MDFITLQKGDINNLEGKEMAYAKISNKQDENIIARYVCANPLDFIDKFGEEEFNLVKNNIEKYIYQQKMCGKDIQNNNFPFYNAEIKVSEEDIKIASEDVLYVGELNNDEQCQITLMGATIIYANYYLKQKKSKSGILEEIFQYPISTKSNKEEIKEVYIDIDSNVITEYLQWNFLDPIMNNLKKENCKERNEIAKDFVRFFKESPFFEDAFVVANILNENPNKEIISLYFEKIIAMATKRYGDAEHHMKRINEISLKNNFYLS
jgi:hypothetical protein